MNAPSIWRRTLVVMLSSVLFLISGTLAWVAAADSESYDLVPGNTFVAGREIGGLTRDDARLVIQARIVDPLAAPIGVRFLGRAATLSGANVVSVNVEEMLNRAFAPRELTTIDERVLPSDPVTITLTPKVSVDTTKVAAWVASLARNYVDRPAVNASVRLVRGRPQFTRASTGYRLDQATSVKLIASAAVAVSPSRRTVFLPVTVVKPRVPDTKFARVIVVDKSERRLYLYKDGALFKKFRVAVGMPHYPTPLGSFKIVQKRYRPSWSNPGSDWAKSMPAYIPPGPSNPLGTRALNLSAPGIRIHGTTKISSIGTAASHGCIRMLRRDVEWLYDRVSVGTPVYVVP